MVDELARLGIRGTAPPYVVMRAPTEQKNLAGKLIKESGKRETQADISAERQLRLDRVRELWEAGCSPREIQAKLNLKHQSVYHDLKALGIDPKKSQPATKATDAREQLLERIAQLIESGQRHSDIAPQVNLSTEMVSYHARKLVKSGRLAASTNIGRRRTTK